eukprot:TRINITY_DN154031_c0_g1_i1.p1 TRINITY_DN154031_c0_g1~~TRINITY_DN154031_c0_g1_i1.p1  ORF type:complete len:134 (+),score=31.57 TRINITY_DN154031_c0_g1_i1:112-513(+)
MEQPRKSDRLKRKPSRFDKSPEPTVPPRPDPKKKKTNAERCRAYKQNLKEDGQKYQDCLKKAQDYSKNYRATATDEQKARNRTSRTEKMREYRARKKAEKGVGTRKSIEEQRAGWREDYYKRKEKKNSSKTCC